MNSDNTITALLETFQECKKNGKSATLFLETRNGDEFATLSVKLPRTPGKTFLGSAKKKSPSSLKRDKARLEKFRKEKRFQETWSPKETSTPKKETAKPGLLCSTHSVEVTPSVEKYVKEGRPGQQDEDLEKNEAIENEIEHSKQDRDEREKVGERFFKNNDEIETLRKVIMEAYQGTANEIDLGRTAIQNDESENEDKTDNIEGAKLWAIRQKQSL